MQITLGDFSCIYQFILFVLSYCGKNRLKVCIYSAQVWLIPCEDSDQIWRMPRLILAGRTWHFVGFCHNAAKIDLKFVYIVRRYG